MSNNTNLLLTVYTNKLVLVSINITDLTVQRGHHFSNSFLTCCMKPFSQCHVKLIVIIMIQSNKA